MVHPDSKNKASGTALATLTTTARHILEQSGCALTSTALLCNLPKFIAFLCCLLLPGILPTPDKQAASATDRIQAGAGAAGGIRTLHVKAPLASPSQSPLLSPANSRRLQVVIRQDQMRWLCGEPAHSQSLENGHKASWEQNQRPWHPSQLSP